MQLLVSYVYHNVTLSLILQSIQKSDNANPSNIETLSGVQGNLAFQRGPAQPKNGAP